jgi:hypothetical protein
MNENFQIFFTLYGQFLEVDAVASLSINGRNRVLIAQYLKVFSNIVSENKQLKSNMQELVKLHKDYIDKNRNKKIDIYNTDYNFKDNIARRLNTDISDTFKSFYRSAKLYYNHRIKLTDNDIKKLYKKNIKEYFNNNFKTIDTDMFLTKIDDLIKNETPIKEALLKQALMEFNNALSHLYNALIGRKTSDNIPKAQIHLQRASLDFNKAIIKDLSHLGKLDDEIKIIKNLRLKEYKKIGDNTINRNSVIEDYNKEIEKILDNL